MQVSFSSSVKNVYVNNEKIIPTKSGNYNLITNLFIKSKKIDFLGDGELEINTTDKIIKGHIKKILISGFNEESITYIKDNLKVIDVNYRKIINKKIESKQNSILENKESLRIIDFGPEKKNNKPVERKKKFVLEENKIEELNFSDLLLNPAEMFFEDAYCGSTNGIKRGLMFKELSAVFKKDKPFERALRILNELFKHDVYNITSPSHLKKVIVKTVKKSKKLLEFKFYAKSKIKQNNINIKLNNINKDKEISWSEGLIKQNEALNAEINEIKDLKTEDVYNFCSVYIKKFDDANDELLKFFKLNKPEEVEFWSSFANKYHDFNFSKDLSSREYEELKIGLKYFYSAMGENHCLLLGRTSCISVFRILSSFLDAISDDDDDKNRINTKLSLLISENLKHCLKFFVSKQLFFYIAEDILYAYLFKVIEFVIKSSYNSETQCLNIKKLLANIVQNSLKNGNKAEIIMFANFLRQFKQPEVVGEIFETIFEFLLDDSNEEQILLKNKQIASDFLQICLNEDKHKRNGFRTLSKTIIKLFDNGERIKGENLSKFWTDSISPLLKDSESIMSLKKMELKDGSYTNIEENLQIIKETSRFFTISDLVFCYDFFESLSNIIDEYHIDFVSEKKKEFEKKQISYNPFDLEKGEKEKKINALLIEIANQRVIQWADSPANLHAELSLFLEYLKNHHFNQFMDAACYIKKMLDEKFKI